MSNKPELSFEELVDFATRNIHSALLVGGGKEMKSAVYMSMDRAITWYIEQQKVEKLKKER